MKKKNGFRRWPLILAVVTLTVGMTACGSEKSTLPDLSSMGETAAILREEGSGTRAEFETLLKLPDSDWGTVADSTEAVLAKVQEDKNAIGYVAYSSVSDDIEEKILQVDGVLPSEESISKDSYPLCRDYYLAYDGELTEVERDFITYVMTKGQDIVKDYCVPVKNTVTFLSDKSKGTIRIEGSTSMEAMINSLAEDYEKENPNAEIEVKATDSSRGLTASISGSCDLAMSSRELKDYEAELLETKSIGRDAIAIVVNKENPVENLTVKQIAKLYSGECKKWADLN